MRAQVHHRSFLLPAIAVLLVFCAAEMSAQQQRFGMGIVIGTPTGISTRFMSPSGNSLDLLLAWRFGDNFFAQGHYDFKLRVLDQTTEGPVQFYAGPGAFMRWSSRNSNLVGFSGNFGIEWVVRHELELFVEVSPKIGFAPATDLDFTAGMGVRYVF